MKWNDELKQLGYSYTVKPVATNADKIQICNGAIWRALPLHIKCKLKNISCQNPKSGTYYNVCFLLKCFYFCLVDNFVNFNVLYIFVFTYKHVHLYIYLIYMLVAYWHFVVFLKKIQMSLYCNHSQWVYSRRPSHTITMEQCTNWTLSSDWPRGCHDVIHQSGVCHAPTTSSQSRESYSDWPRSSDC